MPASQDESRQTLQPPHAGPRPRPESRTKSPSGPRRALVLVDVQNEYARLPLRIRYPRLGDCLERIERVLDVAANAGLPVACVQHAGRPGGAIFDPEGKGFALCPSIERRRTPQWKRVVKHRGSIYADTDLAAWLSERGVDTVTLVGFMANNCILASAAWGETIGLTTEVLSDAVGAINLRNRAGKVDARTVHTTLMALLHSNWAAVATTDDWCRALTRDEPLPRSNLVVSAMAPF